MIAAGKEMDRDRVIRGKRNKAIVHVKVRKGEENIGDGKRQRLAWERERQTPRRKHDCVGHTQALTHAYKTRHARARRRLYSLVFTHSDV